MVQRTTRNAAIIAPAFLALGLVSALAQYPAIPGGRDRSDPPALVEIEIGLPQPEPAQVPKEARSLVSELAAIDIGEAKSSAARKIVSGLTQLQDRYTKAGHLDEAVAARDSVVAYRQRVAGVKPAPSVLTEYRNQVGRVLYFSILGHISGSVWGNGIYTDDSDPGAVAVHAGVLQPGELGVVKVTIFAGRDAYENSEQNGVATQEYGAWGGSYVVEAASGFPTAKKADLPVAARALITELGPGGVRNDGAFPQVLAGLRRLQESLSAAVKLEEALAVRDKIESLLGERLGARTDPGRLINLRGTNGETYYFHVTGRTNGSVWGDGIYTDDSDLGTAAVHAGLLRPSQKGIVRVTILPGRAQYSGSERNGVSTRPYQEWGGGYRIDAVAY